MVVGDVRVTPWQGSRSCGVQGSLRVRLVVGVVALVAIVVDRVRQTIRVRQVVRTRSGISTVARRHRGRRGPARVVEGTSVTGRSTDRRRARRDRTSTGEIDFAHDRSGCDGHRFKRVRRVITTSRRVGRLDRYLYVTTPVDDAERVHPEITSRTQSAADCRKPWIAGHRSIVAKGSGSGLGGLRPMSTGLLADV